MPFDAEKLNYCKSLIEEKLGWGESTSWQQHDFQKLRELIFDKTGVDLSESTLRRVWGKVRYDHMPSFTTLNTIAQFAGFEGWRSVPGKTEKEEPAIPVKKTQWKRIVVAAAAIIVVALLVAFGFNRSRDVKPNEYAFSSRPVTRSIPNSVVFECDASASPTDSVYIQQSWDSRRRALVDKHATHHTAVYYEPGYYQAKLFVGDKVVKEHPLLIPTKGWLGLIERAPVPVYLDSAEIMKDRVMLITEEVVKGKNISLQPEAPVVKMYNVGNFEAVPVQTFSFEAMVKNEYGVGAAACRKTEIMLITDDMPVTVPLSDSGCISELNMMSPGHVVSGKKEDLSGFGVDFKDWVKVECRSDGKDIKYVINGRDAYSLPLPAKPVKILGIAIIFQGTGAVKNIHLRDGEKEVFNFPFLPQKL